MALSSNLPTFTWVKWNGVFVSIDGNTYPIKDDETNHKYIYWDRDFPYQFKTTQVLPETTINRFLVVVNRKGIADAVPQKDLIINWDGQLTVDLSGVNNIIGGMQDQITDLDGKTTTRFVGIETDLDGIKNRVSKVEESDMATKEQLADLWIKSDEIGSRVEEVNTKLDGTNTDLNNFKNSVNQEFVDVITSLGAFNDYIHEAFKDNVISESEALIIKEHLVVLDKEKLDVITQADYLLDNPAVVDPERALLIKSKNEYNEAHKNLGDAINTVIADGKIVPSERTVITTAFAMYNLKLSNLKSAIQKVTDIGVIDKIETAKSEVIQTAHEITATVSKRVDEFEGVVEQEFSQIKQTSNSINLRVEKIEKDYSTNDAMQKAVADAKAEILEQVTDIGSVVDAVQDYIDNAFRDKLLGETFINNLKDMKVELDKEKKDIDDYTLKMTSSEFISSALSNTINIKKGICDTAYTELFTVIDTIIADGAINPDENTQVNLKIQEYNFSVIELKKVLNSAVDDISTNKMNNSINHTNTQITEVNGALSDLNSYVDNAFKDNILDEAEKISLKEKLDTLTLEKKDIDEQVGQMVKNPNFTTSLKDVLVATKTKYDKAHTDLSVFITGLLEKTDIEEVDKTTLAELFTAYVNSLGEIKKQMQISIEDITNQTVNKAKEDLTTQIGDVDNALGSLNDYLENSFKNGLVTEAEKLVIKQQLNNLDVEKKDVDGHYEQIIKNTHVDENMKAQLIMAKNNFDLAHANLIVVINEMLEDVNLDNAERERFNKAYTEYGNKLKEFNSLLQQAVEMIPYYLVELAKTELRGEINDVSNAVNNLEQNLGDMIQDGVITGAEAVSLGTLIQTLDNEAQDLFGRYEEIKVNPDLDAVDLNRLEGAWTGYNTSHGNLKNKIKTVCDSGVVTSEDKVAIDGLLSDYRMKLKTLGSVFEKCIDSITKKKIDDAKGEMTNQLTAAVEILEGKIVLKAEKTEVVNVVDEAKKELQSSIDEAKKATEDLDKVMNGAFKDGVIDEAELKAITDSLYQLDKEKLNVDKQFEQLYGNTDLE